MRCEQDCCHLDGALTVDTIAEVLRELQPHLAQGVKTLDFSGVAQADSAALALIFSAQRATGGTLVVRGLPASFVTLAELYGVDELLPA